MEFWQAYRAITLLSQKVGVSEAVIIEEIEAYIEQSIIEIYGSGDLDKIARWEAIPCKGDRPNAIELVAHVVDRMVKDMREEDMRMEMN